ncbi:MAG: 2Fe-2S iron-sulfur cluster-binding protein [Rhizomicrobium sp.]
MPHIFVTRRDGTVREVDATTSRTLMEVLRDEGFEIQALCGGCCSCATCHVYVDPAFADWVTPMAEDEDMLLEASDLRKPESRLSCQIVVDEKMEGLKLTIAPEE